MYSRGHPRGQRVRGNQCTNKNLGRSNTGFPSKNRCSRRHVVVLLRLVLVLVLVQVVLQVLVQTTMPLQLQVGDLVRNRHRHHRYGHDRGGK